MLQLLHKVKSNNLVGIERRFKLISLIMLFFVFSHANALVLNKTITGLGQQFYLSFSHELLTKLQNNNDLIILEEKMGRFSGNQLVLIINEKNIATVSIRPSARFNLKGETKILSEQTLKHLRKLNFQKQLRKALINEK